MAGSLHRIAADLPLEQQKDVMLTELRQTVPCGDEEMILVQTQTKKNKLDEDKYLNFLF